MGAGLKGVLVLNANDVLRRSVHSPPSFAPVSPKIVFTLSDQDAKNLVGTFSLRHALDLSSYLKPLILAILPYHQAHWISYLETERAFLNYSKEGRRHIASREIQKERKQCLNFEAIGRRRIEANFAGDQVSSDGGAMLLRQVDRWLAFTKQLDKILPDRRNPLFIQHSQESLLRQRIYGLALGYEDLNDHDSLRQSHFLIAYQFY